VARSRRARAADGRRGRRARGAPRAARGDGPELEQLVARREKWRGDIEIRRKAALDCRQALEAEHRHRVEVAEAERGRREVDVRIGASAPPSAQACPPTLHRGARAAPSARASRAGLPLHGAILLNNLGIAYCLAPARSAPVTEGSVACSATCCS